MKKTFILILTLALILSGCASNKDTVDNKRDVGIGNVSDEENNDGVDKVILSEEIGNEKVEEIEEVEEAEETIESYCATLGFIEETYDSGSTYRNRMKDRKYFRFIEEDGGISAPLHFTSRVAEYISYPAERIKSIYYENNYKANLGHNPGWEDAILQIRLIDDGNLKNALFGFLKRNGWENNEGDSNQFYFCEGSLKNPLSRIIYSYYDIHELQFISDKYEGETTKIIEQFTPIQNLSDLSDYVDKGYLMPNAIVNSNIAIDHLYDFNINESGLKFAFKSSQLLPDQLISEIYKMSEGKEVIFEYCQPEERNYELWYAEGNEIVIFDFGQGELAPGHVNNFIESYRYKADVEVFKKFTADELITQ